MRIDSESEIGLACPVLEIVRRVPYSDAVRYRPGEVRNLILLDAGSRQPITSDEVKVGGEIVVGNIMRVVATAAGQQLVAQTGVFVHLQHVDADVRHACSERFGQRKIPAFLRLVRQPGNEINADIANAASPQAARCRPG